jgi:hypothetical protein
MPAENERKAIALAWLLIKPLSLGSNIRVTHLHMTALRILYLTPATERCFKENQEVPLQPFFFFLSHIIKNLSIKHNAHACTVCY